MSDRRTPGVEPRQPATGNDGSETRTDTAANTTATTGPAPVKYPMSDLAERIADLAVERILEGYDLRSDLRARAIINPSKLWTQVFAAACDVLEARR